MGKSLLGALVLYSFVSGRDDKAVVTRPAVVVQDDGGSVNLLVLTDGHEDFPNGQNGGSGLLQVRSVTRAVDGPDGSSPGYRLMDEESQASAIASLMSRVGSLETLNSTLTSQIEDLKVDSRRHEELLFGLAQGLDKLNNAPPPPAPAPGPSAPMSDGPVTPPTDAPKAS